jgi:hypothetical protein
MITGSVKSDEARIGLKARGHEFKMQVRARGKVTIKRLPSR